MAAPEISIVIPVFNEEGNLPRLFKRLTAVMDATGRGWEVIFVNDGSRDNSSALLAGFHQARPRHVRVVEFNRNYGQHTAILAAFERVRGKMILTLDADLQNPPEEIPKFIDAFEKGYDTIGGVRVQRKDSGFRRYASRIINHFREWTTDIRMADQGCMMRAYSKSVVEAVNASDERHTFIPALAHIFASRPHEISIDHSEREVGESKYSLLKLIRLNFDLITGFTLVPLHLFTLVGCLASGMSLFLVGVLLFRRFIYPGASEAEGVFTLFAILFVLVSIVITGIGLIGEYVGRIYQVVQQRPRYIIKTVLDTPDER
jgi:undecaprenyl-phosphate 4-deoxy-4-formamido-L-arabinose transferase